MPGNCHAGVAAFYRLVVILAALMIGACSTPALQQARTQFYNGDTAGALATLPNSEVVAAKDRLLYWLEKGLLLHETGDYEASNRELLAAAQYLDDNDYISASNEARTLLANDWAKRYPGEYTEQLWVHSYLMMNFLSIGKYDSAAVEARRALEKISTHEGALENDNFTRALIALSFEAAGQLNDAYIEYRKLAENMSDAAHLDPVLLGQARKLGFSDHAHEIQQRLKSRGQLDNVSIPDKIAIVFVSSGFIPKKTSGSLIVGHATRVSFPQYYLNDHPAPQLQASVNNTPCDCSVVHSDLGSLINDSLAQRTAKITVKNVVRVAAKDAIADAVRDENRIAGELVRLLFFALEEADTRAWGSLPRHLSLLRIPLPDNESAITLSIADHTGVSTPLPLPNNQQSLQPRFQFHKLRLPTQQ